MAKAVGGGDKAAILKVIRDEYIAYEMKDFKKVASLWVHAAHVRHYGPSPAGPIVYKGWTAIGKILKEAMTKLPDGVPATVKPRWTTKFQVNAVRDMAWVTVSQTTRAGTGAPHEVIRILEKHGGKWKLVYLGFLPEAAA